MEAFVNGYEYSNCTKGVSTGVSEAFIVGDVGTL